MRQARLYDTPAEFADMMLKHVSEVLKVTAKPDAKEPLLMNISLSGQGPADVQVSLHNAFQTYMNSGDLNTAIDYLNGIIVSARACRNEEQMLDLDVSAVYPALRDTRFVEEVGQERELIIHEGVPDLNIIYLELNQGFSKIVNRTLLERHRLTEDKIRRMAFRNLRSEGWTPPSLSLQCPVLKSCTFDVYLDNPHPIECQFLHPDMTKTNVPCSYMIAFTNRRTTIVLRCSRGIDSIESAWRLAKKSRFIEMARRSYLTMPHPVSDQIYWVHEGKFRLVVKPVKQQS